MKHFFRLKKALGTMGPKFNSDIKGYSEGGQVLPNLDTDKLKAFQQSMQENLPQDQPHQQNEDKDARIKALKAMQRLK